MASTNLGNRFIFFYFKSTLEISKSGKGSDGKYFRCCGLCCLSQDHSALSLEHESNTDRMSVNDRDCVPIKFYSQKQVGQVWPVGRGLPPCPHHTGGLHLSYTLKSPAELVTASARPHPRLISLWGWGPGICGFKAP